MFSQRTGWSLAPNALSKRLNELRQAGVSILDMTESNPTHCGFQYPHEILQSLDDPKNLLYEPHPKGLLTARQALTQLYVAKGLRVHPDQMVLTSSTSEAYSFLFKLLADPDEEVLVPCPSYPLLPYLADLNDVKPIPYPIRLGNWLGMVQGQPQRGQPTTAGSPSLGRPTLLPADGGWTALLQVPSVQDEEAFVLELLEKEHLFVHPGYFFDCEEKGILAMNLLLPEKDFQQALRRLLARV